MLEVLQWKVFVPDVVQIMCLCEAVEVVYVYNTLSNLFFYYVKVDCVTLGGCSVACDG